MIIIAEMKKVEINRKRHIAKTITWRIIGSLDTLVLATYFTDDWTIGGWIAFTEVITKTILYYFHERIWFVSNFGVIKPEDK